MYSFFKAILIEIKIIKKKEDCKKFSTQHIHSLHIYEAKKY